MEKMFKYKMVTSEKCQRCNEKEAFKHLLWDCVEAKKVWRCFNEDMEKINNPQEKIENYEDIYITRNISSITTLKIKIT